MQLLYCRGGAVIGVHDSAQQVLGTAYGDGIRVIPYDQPLPTLTRIGDPPPPPWRPSDGDVRPYAQPTETPELLIAYAGQRRWEVGNGGVQWQQIPLNTDRVSQLLIGDLVQHSSGMNPNTMINFTQDGVAYTVKAKDVANMFSTFHTHLQSSRDIETACLYAIGDGAILTYDDVDAKFAAADAATLRGAKKKKQSEK